MGDTLTQFVPYKLKRDYGDDYVTRFFKFDEDCEKLEKAPFEGEIVGSFILNKKQYGFIRIIIKHLVGLMSGMATANLNICEKLVTNTTTASKYIPKSAIICIN